MKLLEITWNWSLLPMTFLINLPKVLSNMIGWNDLGVLYEALLGLGITMVVEILKWDGVMEHFGH